MRLHQRRFDKRYNSLYREVPMASMRDEYTDEAWWRWLCNFREVANSLVKQYLKILAARKELFDFDVGGMEDRGCEIVVDKWRDDEPINWGLEDGVDIVSDYDLDFD